MPSGWPERFCCDEDLCRIGYDGRDASRDLEQLRKGGPRRETQELIEVIRAEGVDGARLLDIGAGVGAVHLALLEAGAAAAVDVDASREYLAAARAEAERRGLDDRVDHRFGDVVELVRSLPPADVVTLDSVICCYPYLPRLLDAAVSGRPRLVGLAYPRDTWWMVVFMHLYNAASTLRRSPSRYVVHRHANVVGALAERGYTEFHDGGSKAWRVTAYRRDDA